MTTFASNVARLRAVADAARAADREVVVVGRAMERVVQVARETGYLDGVQNFRGMDLYGHFPPDKVLALCTGSQGEPRAALARIANNDHPQVTLNKGDSVIFSSRTIPGNEKAVGAIINGLVTQGVEVITDRTHLVHVSGHPRRDELRDMISWVRPQLLIPVHGEALHLFEHAKLARAAGVPKVLICRNGDLVRLGPGRSRRSSTNCRRDGSTRTARFWRTSKSRAVIERRRLAFAGCAFVAIAMTEKGELADDPEVDLVGIPEKNTAGEIIDEIVFDVVVSTVEGLPRARRRDPDATGGIGAPGGSLHDQRAVGQEAIVLRSRSGGVKFNENGECHAGPAQSCRDRGQGRREGREDLWHRVRRRYFRGGAAAGARRHYRVCDAAQYQDRIHPAARRDLADRQISRAQCRRRHPSRLL